MPLIDRDRTVRIDLPVAGEWVEVREQLSKGDQARIQAAVVRNAALRPDGTPDVALDLEAATFATLEIAIVRWSFSEPVTPENIRRLDEASYDAIVAALDRLYARRSPEEQKNSSDASPTRS